MVISSPVIVKRNATCSVYRWRRERGQNRMKQRETKRYRNKDTVRKGGREREREERRKSEVHGYKSRNRAEREWKKKSERSQRRNSQMCPKNRDREKKNEKETEGVIPSGRRGLSAHFATFDRTKDYRPCRGMEGGKTRSLRVEKRFLAARLRKSQTPGESLHTEWSIRTVIPFAIFQRNNSLTAISNGIETSFLLYFLTQDYKQYFFHF